MNYKISHRTMMQWMVILMIFLPASLHIAGMYSYRLSILLGLLFAVFSRSFKLSLRKFIYNPLIWVYFLYTCLRYVLDGDISTGIGLVFDSVIVLFCAFESIRSIYDFRKFCNLFTNVMIIYCILGLIECLTGFNLWATITNTSLYGIRYGLHRSFGSFENYMNNGTFLMLSLVPVMWGIQNIKGKKFIVSYVLILINILATLTRAAILGVAILQCIWLIRAGILKSLKRHIKAVLCIGVLIIIILQLPQVKVATQAIINMFLAVLDPTLAAEMASTFGVNAKGTGERLELYSWVWESIDNKWLGAGPTTAFGYEWITPTGSTALKWSIENQGLAVLFKYGLSGLILYIVMMFSIVRNVIRNSNSENINKIQELKPKFTLSFLVGSAILIYIFMGFFHAYLSEFRFFFILIGLLAGYLSSLNTEYHQKTK